MVLLDNYGTLVSGVRGLVRDKNYENPFVTCGKNQNIENEQIPQVSPKWHMKKISWHRAVAEITEERQIFVRQINVEALTLNQTEERN